MRTISCLIVYLVALAVSSSAGDGQTIVAQAPASRSIESLAAILKSRVPKDVPVLEDLFIVKPDPSLPTDLVQLSGVWVGEFRGERTNRYMADQVFVFERVSEASLTVVSMGIGRYRASRGERGSNDGQTWSTRYENLGHAGTSPVTVTNTKGNQNTYELRDGKLKIRTVSSGGSVWIGTFEKVAW